ncbi:MAG: hypothetical protein KJ607_01920, partial [Bacteroidetes bacterium]|nr:hypothetical protein [Bacteroidota bacterium]
REDVVTVMSDDLKFEAELQRQKFELLEWYVRRAIRDLAQDNHVGAKYTMDVGLDDCSKLEKRLRKKHDG